MSMQDIAAALDRAESVYRRRPQAGLHDDATATASWVAGTRVVSSHANGMRVQTDMPVEFGGSGDQVSPGWMFRAGIASCLATSIAMTAARNKVDLKALEVRAGSRSDTRGLLGIEESDGSPVYAGPGEMRLDVRIAAANATPAQLRALVDDSLRRSPMPNAVRNATALGLNVEIGEGNSDDNAMKAGADSSEAARVAGSAAAGKDINVVAGTNAATTAVAS